VNTRFVPDIERLPLKWTIFRFRIWRSIMSRKNTVSNILAVVGSNVSSLENPLRDHASSVRAHQIRGKIKRAEKVISVKKSVYNMVRTRFVFMLLSNWIKQRGPVTKRSKGMSTPVRFCLRQARSITRASRSSWTEKNVCKAYDTRHVFPSPEVFVRSTSVVSYFSISICIAI